jgi:hypothetical protein
METKLYDLVSCLADNYGFDADEAFEYVRWETDIDHVGGVIGATEKVVKVEVKAAAAPAGDDEKIATCRKNIENWTKKAGSAKDAVKHQEKIDKEQKKLDKLLAKTPAVVVKKEEPKKAAEPVKKKDGRIKRMSPIMADQLKKALTDVGLEFNDKLKKEFVQFVDDLADDDFKKVGLADHMREFAKLKAPAPVEEEAEESEAEESEEEVEVDVKNTAADAKQVSLAALQKIELTASVDPPGTYLDTKSGEFVTGPPADEDEDFNEMKFESKTYAVGEKTGRVYEARDEGDFFAGFIGVGQFKSMAK